MKVQPRRRLFYKPGRNNFYRVFLWLFLILVIGWVGYRMQFAGTLKSPFAATATATRSVLSYAEEGDAYFTAGNLDKAIAAYQQAVRLDPAAARIWAEMARIQTYSSSLLTTDQARHQRLQEALDSANQAVTLAPEDSMGFAIQSFVLDWNAGAALTNEKERRDLLLQAEQAATRALQLDNRNALAQAFYAEILVDQQKWFQAEQVIIPAVENGAQIMDVHRVYAYVLESTIQYRQAIEEYQKALEINPNLTFLYISIAQNYRALAFRASEKDPQRLVLYNQALDNFALAAKLNEQLGIKDPLPYLGIAKTYAQLGDFFAAARNAIKAVSFEPTNPDLYGQLGDVYKRGRNYETAIIALKCAVEGCTAAEACEAIGGCFGGNTGAAVVGLPLTSGSAPYYLDYGSVLAAFGPRHPEYCITAVRVLSQLMAAYGDDDTVRINAQEGLNICSAVTLSQTQTPIPATTPTMLPTP
jgi:tetratricopeptide (TPR) repeat protein